MKKKGKINHFILLSLLSIAIVVMGSLGYRMVKEFQRNKLLDEMNTAIAFEKFSECVPEIHDFNNGITLVGDTPYWVKQYPPTVNYALWVINHSPEPISFPDSGFGMSLFSYDPKENLWHIVKFKRLVVMAPMTIDPSDEKENHGIWDFNPTILNSNTIIGVDYRKPVRVFVAGVGNESGIYYGAYLDIFLVR